MRSILKDPRVGRVRHQHHRQRRTQVRTWFLVLLLFAASAAVTWQFARQQPVASLSGSFASLEPGGVSLGKTPDAKSVPASSAEYLYIASRPSRPAYAYSIVPGGVGSAEELRQIAEHDPVVAQHFQGFDYQHAHLVTVAEKQSMYVAYRKGDKVYWTRKKVALHPGETLISDGKIAARTRCGNRIALAPLGPPALAEPAEADLNQPLFSSDMVTPEVDPQPETYAAAIPMAAPVEGNALQPTKRKRMIPFFILPFFGLPGGGSSHTPLAVTP